LLSPSPRECVSIFANLISASGYQAHTTSPSASAHSSCALKRPSHPAPNVRDDRETPLFGYTRVAAPFDGYVSAHLASVGELVGAASPPTQLATIVALDPIYVNFNVNEQDVLRIRAEAARRGITVAELRQLLVQVGLQTEQGYPHEGKLDYIAPTLNQSTGTLAVRGIFPNPNRTMLPGYFVRVRVPIDKQERALLVPDIALSSDQGGRYLLVVNGDNVVEQRHV
jgi:RND family efflux transporter MFP subunit